MWHVYEGHFWGMHWVWWILWIILVFWIFATPWNIPGQRKRKDSPLEILKRRYASGEIDTAEYQERKQLLEKD